MRFSAWMFVVGVACVVPTLDGVAQTRTAATPPPDGSAAVYRQLLNRHCVACHNDRRPSADLSLQSVDVHSVGTALDEVVTWEKVIRKLHARSMPPAGRPRPTEADYEGFAGWLETSVDEAAARTPNPGRRPALHRLNRAEYSNAIRDLLALDIDGATLLPADDSGYGFDNIADVLSVSPMLTERYLTAARQISRLAVGDPEIRPTTTVFATDKYLKQDDRVSDDLPFGSRGGLAVTHTFPVDGDYVAKIFLLRTYDGRVRGLLEQSQMEVRLDGVLLKTLSVGEAVEPVDGQVPRRDYRNVEDDGQEVRFTAPAGPAILSVSFVDTGIVPEGMRRPRYPVTSYEYAGDQTIQPGIATLELSGPYDVTGVGDTPSRERIFVCHPSGGGDDRQCASDILSSLARRAYRRPVTERDTRVLMEFFDIGHAGDTDRGFEAGIEMGLRRLLVSPDFLFRREHDADGVDPGSVYEVSDVELASRLSFFLWSSIPDDELLTLAETGDLSQPKVLGAQVRRMLADDRSRSIVSNFGGQWLYLRNMALVSPDPYTFADFDGNLRLAMRRELELFLDSQVREDHGIPSLLTADYTFVNERLARHYDVPNVYGNHFRRVALTGQHDVRRGLLGKGSVLTVTSYAHRTSPVLRGKWLLENVLGSPPPPPPPDVPALEENTARGEARSVRERLEQHRENPVCASCHQVMDPLGFALENFDGIGRWRSHGEDGAEIDAAGTLIDGRAVDGPASLRNALVERPERFVATVAEKLLTYALGRGLEYYDAPAVRKIVRDAAADGYRWSDVVLGIAQSPPFRMRRTHQP